jgi:DNA polymerase
VYGTGAIDVDIMIVGEGPGVEEDLQGIPFVGKAGQLLDKMLAAMGYARSQVYIGNVVKCRPPNNRVPEDDEIGACMPYLREQVELVQPKVMVAMGGTAVRGLFGLGGITRVRGRWKLYQGKIPVMPTFHPAYLLRNESAKREVWDDLKQVLRHLNREVPKREK